MSSTTPARAPRFLVADDDCTAVVDTKFQAHSPDAVKVLCRAVDPADAASIARAVNLHEQLVAALRIGRVAIDLLMAQLIEAGQNFKPTQSAAWPALVAVKNALDVAEV